MAEQFGATSATPMGARLESFAPSLATRIAGLIVGTLLVTGGGFFVWSLARDAFLNGGNLPLNAEKGTSWFSVILGGIVVSLYGAGGFFLLRHVVRLGRHRVEFCENGFRYRTHNALDEVAWADIMAIRQTNVPDFASQAKCISIVVMNKSSKIYAFDRDSVNDLTRIKALLFEHTGHLQIPWEII